VICQILMTDWIEQCICLKDRETASVTYEIYKTALGDSTMGRMQTFVWFSHFRCGETGLKL